jgi:hypothetical protein
MRTSIPAIFLALVALGPLASSAEPDSIESQAGPSRFAIPGWSLIGVWQMDLGFDAQIVIERKGTSYRLRYVDSKNPKDTDGASPLERSGDTYKEKEAITGDYFRVRADGRLACYDRDGYVTTLDRLIR